MKGNNTKCLCPITPTCKRNVPIIFCTWPEAELEYLFRHTYGKKEFGEVFEFILKGNFYLYITFI